MAKSFWDVLDKAGDAYTANQKRQMSQDLNMAKIRQEHLTEAVTFNTNPMAVKMRLPDAGDVLKSPLFIFSAALLMITLFGRQSGKG